MQKTTYFFIHLLVLLGERSAILFVFAVVVILLFSQHIAQASATTSFQAASGAYSVDVPTPTDTPIPTNTPTPTLTPTPTPTLLPTPTVDPNDESIWLQLAQCESNGHWNEDSGNGYYGGLQFSQSTWQSVGGSGNPAQASQTEQITRAKMLQAQRGWGVWGACAAKLRLD